MNCDQDAKGRILLAVAELLKEEPDVEKITVRQIAERAGVGVGLISYHFGSKYNLLTEAIDRNVYSTVEDFISKTKGKHIEPIEKLKAMLKSMFNLMQSQRKTARFMLIQGIMKGEMRATLYLVPVLKELFKGQMEDLDLRILALQIVEPIRIAIIDPVHFQLYSGIDMYDVEERNRFIDMLVDNVVKAA